MYFSYLEVKVILLNFDVICASQAFTCVGKFSRLDVDGSYDGDEK